MTNQMDTKCRNARREKRNTNAQQNCIVNFHWAQSNGNLYFRLCVRRSRSRSLCTLLLGWQICAFRNRYLIRKGARARTHYKTRSHRSNRQEYYNDNDGDDDGVLPVGEHKSGEEVSARSLAHCSRERTRFGEWKNFCFYDQLIWLIYLNNYISLYGVNGNNKWNTEQTREMLTKLNRPTSQRASDLARTASIIEIVVFFVLFVRRMNVYDIFIFLSTCVIELWDMGLKSFERFCCDFCAFIKIMEQQPQQQPWCGGGDGGNDGFNNNENWSKLLILTFILFCVCMLFAV